MKWQSGLMLALWVSLLGTAHAVETSVDQTNCFAGSVVVVSKSKELTTLSYELRGVTRSNLEASEASPQTYHCVGVLKRMAGERTENGYCKFMDVDGDFTIRQYSRMGAGNPQGNWQVLQGTGKWQGATGKGTFKSITRAKPITPGTFQNCSVWKGTLTLPK
jgi:hypothetical protein